MSIYVSREGTALLDVPRAATMDELRHVATGIEDLINGLEPDAAFQGFLEWAEDRPSVIEARIRFGLEVTPTDLLRLFCSTAIANGDMRVVLDNGKPWRGEFGGMYLVAFRYSDLVDLAIRGGVDEAAVRNAMVAAGGRKNSEQEFYTIPLSPRVMSETFES